MRQHRPPKAVVGDSIYEPATTFGVGMICRFRDPSVRCATDGYRLRYLRHPMKRVNDTPLQYGVNQLFHQRLVSMPEGHKTHHLAQQHRQWLCGHPLRVTSPQGRFRSEARKVSGQVVFDVRAAGKHLFYEFDSGLMIHVHLGRYGKFRQHATPPPRPLGQVRMRLVNEVHSLDLTGPSTCRVIDGDQQQQVLSKLGPDPLNGGRRSNVWQKVHYSPKPIGALLLDQSVVAGIGNIFRAEVLFETEVDPRTPGNELSKESFDRIWRSLRKMMQIGLKYGRIISVTAREAGMPLSKVQGKDRFRIYGKTDCPRCGSLIQTPEIAARKHYVCFNCQRSGS